MNVMPYLRDLEQRSFEELHNNEPPAILDPESLGPGTCDTKGKERQGQLVPIEGNRPI